MTVFRSTRIQVKILVSNSNLISPADIYQTANIILRSVLGVIIMKNPKLIFIFYLLLKFIIKNIFVVFFKMI